MHFHGDNLSACGHAPNQRFSLPAPAAVGIAAGFIIADHYNVPALSIP